MSLSREEYPRKENFDRSIMKTFVTDALKKKKIKLNSLTPKITQNNIKHFTLSKNSKISNENDLDFSGFLDSKVKNTMNRRLGENFTNKPWQQKNQSMVPSRWEPTGWKYPFLHHEDPPSTREHLRPRNKPSEGIRDEKSKKNYFKTSYSSQFQDKIGFKNSTKSFSRKGSGFKDTDRLNEYLVSKGIPENSNYISACYPPIQLSQKGINDEYVKLKRYGPLFKMDLDRGKPTHNYLYQKKKAGTVTNRQSPIPISDEEWFLKCKNNKKELYKNTKDMNKTVSYGRKGVLNMSLDKKSPSLMIDVKLEKLDEPGIIDKLSKSNKIKDYLKYVKYRIINDNVNNYIPT